MNVYKFNAASYFICAIIYGDYSGIDDDEHVSISDFLNECAKLGQGHFSVPECDSYFAECEICGLMADCEELEYVVVEE